MVCLNSYCFVWQFDQFDRLKDGEITHKLGIYDALPSPSLGRWRFSLLPRPMTSDDIRWKNPRWTEVKLRPEMWKIRDGDVMTTEWEQWYVII